MNREQRRANGDRTPHGGHVDPSPTPASWRVNGATITRADGTAVRAVVLEIGTPTGVQTTYWTTADALRLRDALTERCSGLTIAQPGDTRP